MSAVIWSFVFLSRDTFNNDVSPPLPPQHHELPGVKEEVQRELATLRCHGRD